MIDLLIPFEVALSVILILIILIQNKNVSLNLSSMSWWMGAVTKRGPEKILNNLTIIFWALFIVNSVILFIYK